MRNIKSKMWSNNKQKWLCNEKNANCTALSQVIDLALFCRVCGCAIAHACTYAHAPLKAPILLVCAAVRMCISIENYRERCINAFSSCRESSICRYNLIGYCR
jgi:hypothetical protein